MLKKKNFISKNSRYYLFKSCGYLHEKDILEFKFTTIKIPILSYKEKGILKLKRIEEKERRGILQTTLFDFIN